MEWGYRKNIEIAEPVTAVDEGGQGHGRVIPFRARFDHNPEIEMPVVKPHNHGVIRPADDRKGADLPAINRNLPGFQANQADNPV